MSLEEIAEFAQAFSPSRRTVLAMLLAGSGGLAGRGPGEARKGRMGPDCGKQARKRCTADAAQCRKLYLPSCQLEPAQCEAAATCCDTCSADGLLRCLLALQNSLE